MDAKKYYYNIFRKDFEETLSNVTVGGDGHFHVIEFFLRKERDALKHIQKENLSYFLSSLAGTILIDQLIYTYFQEDYDDFRKITNYPKITWSIGCCFHIKPWKLFDHRIALSRGLKNPQKKNDFIEFMAFFVEEQKKFFQKNNFKKASWTNIRDIALKDNDIVLDNFSDGEYGSIFKKILENEKINEREN